MTLVGNPLFGTGIRVFPRSNWIGADTTFNQLGLLMAAHNMLQRCFAIVFPPPAPGPEIHPAAMLLPLTMDPDDAQAQDQEDRRCYLKTSVAVLCSGSRSAVFQAAGRRIRCPTSETRCPHTKGRARS